jgi:hypothetical protein
MSVSEILQSVQFIDARGKRFAVIDAEDWETLDFLQKSGNRQQATGNSGKN